MDLTEICKLVRYTILTSTTAAGSGHPTSSLSGVELLVTLFFGGFLHYDLSQPKYPLNDRVIFSKGHAAPLLYSLYHAAGVISREELLTLRKFDSVLEGHPTVRFKYIDVATGSLGQGLSVGLGMALGVKKLVKETATKMREPKIWVLMGDSEMAEGQIWEALEVAAHYKLNNLVGIVDVNRLGQRGETMLGWDIEKYAQRVESFGWEAIVLQDGHDLQRVKAAFEKASLSEEKPVMIIAKTQKGKGVSFLENAENWHGKTVPEDRLKLALDEIGSVDLNLVGIVAKPEIVDIPFLERPLLAKFPFPSYNKSDKIATREAYGKALSMVNNSIKTVVAMDAETSNSTFADALKKSNPEAFYEMYIAEQNMVSAAVGISKLGFIPFISSFAAFFTRAFDQIRMAQYSNANIKIVGSHAGVSIGTDGSSQMALEDISMMRSISNAIVLYPSDAVSTYKLIEQSALHKGICYIRTTRQKTPVLYENTENFKIGGSHILYHSEKDTAVIFAAGITLHESIKAYHQLLADGLYVAVVDLYCIKPLDEATIKIITKNLNNVLVVEDHYPEGGIGEALKYVLHTDVNFIHLAVRKPPRSGTPEELLRYEEIDAQAIVGKVKDLKI